MHGSQRAAILGVLVMLVAAIGPATAVAAADTGGDDASALDGDVDFSVTPDDDDDNESDDDVENESDDDVENETDDEGPNVNASSSSDAMNEFVTQLHGVIENATNDSSVQAPGLVIASYAVHNNPGNAPAHAGPPNSTNATNSSHGPPAHAGNGSNASDGHGPNAGNGNGNGGDDTTDERVAPAATGDVFALRGADTARVATLPFDV